MSYLHCISSLGWPDANLGQLLALAARHRIAALELRALEGVTSLPALLARRYARPEAWAEELRRSAVRVVALDTSGRALDGRPADRDELLAFGPWAAAAGVRWLRVFDGGTAADEAELTRARDLFAWWAGVRAARGWPVDLMVETHDALTTTAAIRRFTAAVPGARLLWDAHHTWRKGGEAPTATWAAIHPSVAHVHVKDSVGVPSARHPYTYVAPGRGEFPMAALATVLRESFGGCVSLEWEKLWHPYLPTLDEALTIATQSSWW